MMRTLKYHAKRISLAILEVAGYVAIYAMLIVPAVILWIIITNYW